MPASSPHDIDPPQHQHPDHRGEADGQWRTVLAEYLRGDQVPEDGAMVDLALGFRLHAEPLERGPFSWASEEATWAHIEAGKNLFVSIQPLRRSQRGGWVRGSLSWRSFEFRMEHPDFDPVHADVLTRIFAFAEAERSHSYGVVEQLWLNSFRSPLVWEALLGARAAGVACVGLGPVTSVIVTDPASLVIDLRSRPGEGPAGAFTLRPAVRLGDRLVEDARPLGMSAVLRVEPAGAKADKFRIEVLPLDKPMTYKMQKLYALGTGVDIPEHGRDEFFDKVVPKLARDGDVGSSNGSVLMPAPPAPMLRVVATYSRVNNLDLVWSWQYGRRSFPVMQVSGSHVSADQSSARVRDFESEARILAQVREVWPTAGGAQTSARSSHRVDAAQGRERLTDVDTAVFSSRALGQLQAMRDVRVEIEGTRHEYRELDAAPHVKITQVPNPSKNDWFDLHFTVTIQGRTLPFATLFKALAMGQTRILMEDRTFVSLERPEFDVIRALIAEGEALAEWEPEHQHVSTSHVAFFHDLADAADEVEVAEQWAATVGKLRDMTKLPQPSIPRGLRASLRPYQVEGFRFLAFLHELGLGGILADDMGLGKTLQTLALIQHAVQEREDARGDSHAPARPFLVVAPSSVVGVWDMQAKRFTPGLRVAVVDRTRRVRATPLSSITKGVDLVIASYTIVRSDAQEFAREEFAGLIVDEAQFVKNRTSRVHQSVKRINAPFRLAITGTPVENSLSDLWALMHLSAPGVLGSAVTFRTLFREPIESGQYPQKMDVLRRRVRPFMLRRTKEQVAPELVEKQDQVVRVELNARHRALYDSVLQRERKKVMGLIDQMDKNRFIVFRSLTLLRMLALDPAIVDGGAYADVPSSKLEALMVRLEDVVPKGHRVLVFSQFTSFLRRVGEALHERGMEFSYLDGATRQREEVIRSFREGEHPVFLISLKAGGFGVTLTEADYVFVMDPWWNPAAENQAIDRAHRIGQDKKVMVYRMVAHDTIEEKVLGLQSRKRELFDSLTDQGQAFADAVQVDDVRWLLGVSGETL